MKLASIFEKRNRDRLGVLIKEDASQVGKDRRIDRLTQLLEKCKKAYEDDSSFRLPVGFSMIYRLVDDLYDAAHPSGKAKLFWQKVKWLDRTKSKLKIIKTLDKMVENWATKQHRPHQQMFESKNAVVVEILDALTGTTPESIAQAKLSAKTWDVLYESASSKFKDAFKENSTSARNTFAMWAIYLDLLATWEAWKRNHRVENDEMFHAIYQLQNQKYVDAYAELVRCKMTPISAFRAALNKEQGKRRAKRGRAKSKLDTTPS